MSKKASEAYVGVDIGTTGIRAGVYDGDFRLLGTGTGESIIRRGPDNELIQEPEEIYRETAAAVRRAVRQSGVDARGIEAVSFDGQMAGVMGIDENWNPVTPYDSWLDTRCGQQVRAMEDSARQLVIEKTGSMPSYNHGPKILWWKQNRPRVFDRIRSFIMPSAYVAGRLCALGGEQAFIDWTYLHFSGLANNRGLCWDGELASRFGIPLDKLPRIVSPCSVVGEASPAEAEAFGVPAGAVVAAGCGDTASCFLGTGAVEPGIAVDVAGTASVFAMTVDRFAPHQSGIVYASRSVVENMWYSMSYINGGGMNLEWFQKNFAPDQGFDQLNRAAAEIPPGSEGLIFIPHLEGRGYPSNPSLRGQWSGFTRDHTPAHFYRSVLEGTAYEYALYKESIQERLGERDLRYDTRAVAGGAKSPVWNKIKADVLESPYCTINREDIALLGQALIAAAAAGRIGNIAGHVKGIVTVREVTRPDPEIHRLYRECVDRYRRTLSLFEHQ